MKKNVLVTGANGQLGKCLEELSIQHPSINFIFKNSQGLDITNKDDVRLMFGNTDFDYCINCAAYTAVDKAEEDKDKARDVNVNGVINIAESCKENNTTLIHISTDFVFDGSKNEPYSETDIPNPDNGGGSSGGSTSLFSLLMLSCLYLVRRKLNK